jgi:FkbM family methyltransferase
VNSPHLEIAEIWLSTLRNQASAFDMRNGGQQRSEHHLDELFFALVQLARPTLFLEVGAHNGLRAVRAKRLLPDARAVALEANPTNHRLFSGRTDFTALGVEYLHAAATERPGEVDFNVEHTGSASVTTGSSSLLTRHVDRPGVDATSTAVPGVPIDEFTPPDGRSCVWIDVEGANQQVLSGGQTLLNTVDVLKIEVEEAEFWGGQWLSIDVIAHLLGHDLVPLVRDRAQGEWQYNVILVSKDLARRPETSSLVMAFLERASARELPGPLGRLRRSERVRGAARALARRAAR